MVLDLVLRPPAAEIHRVRSGGKVVDFHSRDDLAAGCVKAQAKATAAGEQVERPGARGRVNG